MDTRFRGLVIVAAIHTLTGCKLDSIPEHDALIDTHPDNINLKVPTRILENKNISIDDIWCELKAGDDIVIMSNVEGTWTGSIAVKNEESLILSITWFENFQDVTLGLARASRSIHVGDSADTHTFQEDQYEDSALLFDYDGDGASNLAERIDGTNPLSNNNDYSGTLIEDRYSLDSNWSNNSVLSRDGQYATSSYTKGLQRIFFCLGLHPENQNSIAAFADGIFGPNTQASVEQFQYDRGISVDGIVGPQTWGALQDVAEIDQGIDAGNGYNSHSISGLYCSTEAQFFQSQSTPFDWKMAKTPGSSTMVQFSINGPNVE